MVETANGERFLRRKCLAISALVAAVCLLSTEAAGDSPPDRRAIHALGDQYYPPITYLENGVPGGFDVDVLRALGEVMGRDVEIELMPWNLAQRQVQEGKAETLTGLSITDERRESWDFATPTLTRSFSLFVNSEEVTIHSVDDLRGKRVGVTAGGIPAELLQGRPGLNLVVVANYEEGFDLLKRGGVDAIAADTWVAGYTLNKHRIEGITLAGKPFATLDSAIAVPKGHQALLQEINHGLEKLKQRGTIEAIRQKWEPKQIVYLLKEDVKAFVVWAAVIAGLILFGGMMAWLLTLRKEVKARTRAENKLRTSEGLLSEICGNVPEVFWLREVGSEQIRYVSPAWDEITGYPPPKNRSDFLRIVHPDDAERVAREALDSPSGGVDHQYRIVRSDGSVRWLHVRTFPIRNGSGEIYRIGGTGRDVTEEVSRNQELRQFRAAVDASADLVTLIDPRRVRYVDINDAMCRALGYSREELLAMSPGEVFSVPGSDLAKSYEGLMLGDPALSSVEGVYRRKDGSTFPVESFRRVVPSGEGDIIVAIARDITARKGAEEKIQRLNRVYAVLSGINALIVRVRGRDELFREACRIVVEAGRFRMAWIGVVDRETMKVEPVAWGGTAEAYFESAPLDVKSEVLEGRSLTGRAVREKTAVISNDVQNDPRVAMKKQCAEHGINSLALMPLLVGGAAAGVLALYAGERGFFDDDEMKLLLELAGDISFALDYAQNQEKLDYLAYYDSLTGLANRTLFHERLVQYVSAAQIDQSKLALVFVDIDRFKAVNDSLGRQAGDELIKQVAERIERHAGPVRMARISADRFAIVRSGVSSESEVARLIEHWLAECFDPRFLVNGADLRVSAKAGIALFPNDGPDADALFRNAEAALKRAKATGEQYLFHAPHMTERTAAKLALENKLRQALEREEFVLHYQPKVDTGTRRIDGVEALIRWQSPEMGLVPPLDFIPLLEETGLILEVGAWALRRAVLVHRDWKVRGLPAPRIAVNVSPIQLRKRDFVATVEEALRLGSVPPGIDLEITESVVMSDLEANVEKLEAVSSLGIQVAIDDFGTGFSSLGYLTQLPVHSLKIDRSFVITMLKRPNVMVLVSTIISMAHSLKLQVAAEGVESEEQAAELKRLGCDQMQGYIFSKPVPAEELEALLMRKPSPSRQSQARREKKA